MKKSRGRVALAVRVAPVRAVRPVSSKDVLPCPEGPIPAGYTCAYDSSVLFMVRTPSNRRTTTPPRPGEAAVREIVEIRTLATRAALLIDVLQKMPPPKITVPPGKAITGLPMFVVVEKPVLAPFGGADPDLPDERIDFVCEATSHVLRFDDEPGLGATDDWGAPYPNGTIRYTWTDAGTATVTSTVNWVCAYEGVEGSGELARQSTATIELPVVEYRPVIVDADTEIDRDSEPPNELTDDDLELSAIG